MDGAPSRIKILLLFFWTITGFCILGCCLWLWMSDYNSFTDTLLNASGKIDWRVYFETSVLPLHRFILLRYLISSLFAVWLAVSFGLRNKLSTISIIIGDFVGFLSSNIKNQINNTGNTEKIFLAVLFIVFAIRGLYLMQHYELQYDEAWTYNHFISKGFFISAVSPNNNHIFYTLIACITDYLPLEGKYCLRIPVLVGSFCSCLLFYTLARSLFGWRPAFTALAFFAFSPAVSQYSMYARGYIFQILFTVLALWSTLKISEGTKSPHYFWFIWTIANILGLYSVPTNAFVLILLDLFLLFYAIIGNKNILKPLFISNLCLALVAALLFFPFLLTGGLEILHTAAAIPQGESFLSYQDKVSDWLLWGGGRGTAVYWFLISMVFFVSIIIYKYRKIPLLRNPLILVLLFLLIPSFVNLMTGSQPPFRIWCFLTPFIAVFVAASVHLFPIRFFNNFSLGLCSFFIIITMIWRMEVHYAIRWSEIPDRDAVIISDVLMNKRIDECYFFSNYDKPLIEYYFLRKGKKLKTAMVFKNSKSYAPFVDTLLYNSVIWDKEDGTPTAEQVNWYNSNYPDLLYENNRIEIRIPLKKD